MTKENYGGAGLLLCHIRFLILVNNLLETNPFVFIIKFCLLFVTSFKANDFKFGNIVGKENQAIEGITLSQKNKGGKKSNYNNYESFHKFQLLHVSTSEKQIKNKCLKNSVIKRPVSLYLQNQKWKKITCI